jgi:hypothetical protein
MARLNLYGMAKGMFLGAACCWIQQMNCPFSSLEMAF